MPGRIVPHWAQPSPTDWQPTGEYRLAKDPWGTVVLQRQYGRMVWPDEPYREKGEETYEEKWETQETVRL